MRSLVLVAFTGFLAAAPGVAVQEGRDPDIYKIAVEVDLVVFNVTVADARGRHVSGLEAADFRVREDGRDQEIALFNAEDFPASVGLIIDNSGSMGRKRADVVEAALAFVYASHAEDEMFVIHFNEDVHTGLPASIPFTSDREQIRPALLGAAPAGLTALYDALGAGLDHLKTGARDRKALVVLSDGGDNASRLSLDDVLRSARESSATIYTIGIYDDGSDDRDPGVLQRLAELSGGRAYFPESPGELAEVWRDIAGGIRSQYTVGYYSADSRRDGAFREVDITVEGGGRGLRVTTREGYFAPAAPGER